MTESKAHQDGTDLWHALVPAHDAGPVWASYWNSGPTDEPVGSLSFDMHYELEVGILMSGRLRCHYSRWQQDIGPGEVWLCGAWERHGRAVIEGPYERAILYIHPAFLMRMNLEGTPPFDWTAPFKVPPGQRPQASGAQREALLGLAQRVRARCTPPPEREDRTTKDRAWALPVLLEALFVLREGWRSPASAAPLLPPHHASMSAAVDMVLNGRGLIRLQEVAAKLGLSRNAFARQFQSFTGIPFTEFCRRHRLRGAAAQLLQTTDPVKLAAHEWGFADQSHLNRCFLRYYKCSPVEYRQRGR